MKISSEASGYSMLAIMLAAFIIKCVMISYGLPYQIHVDETTILKDPFKLMLDYTEGNFGQSTNLYNWFILVFFALVFVAGLIAGKWSGVSDFRQFLIGDSPELLFYGRFLSVIFSMLATLILMLLIRRITKNLWLQVIFLTVVVFNPIELNAVNWIKFDSLAYLAYAFILYFAYEYFVLGNTSVRTTLYTVMIVCIAVRIELIAYLAGFFIYDFLSNSRRWEFIRSLALPVVAGAILYSAITLLPVKLVFSLVNPTAESGLVTSPTFESAITSKLSMDSVLHGLAGSDFYIYCLVSLLGPVAVVVFFLSWKKRSVLFLLFPFAIMAFFLAIFPVKGTHYLLNVSLIILVGGFIYIDSLERDIFRYALALFSVLWMGSFVVSQLALVAGGDVRIKAREYLLAHTAPSDTLYVEGVFTQIQDKPGRYALKGEAAPLIGSTGLSNKYYAMILKDEETRTVVTVSGYEPFAGTRYEGIFNNLFDSAALLRDKPNHYVFVASEIDGTSFEDYQATAQMRQFYELVTTNYTREKIFDYPHFDPRLEYATTYYFRPVVIYHRKPDAWRAAAQTP